MSAVELKPCPFCGGEAELTKYLHSTDDDVYTLYGVRCLYGESDQAALAHAYGVEHSIYGYFFEYQAIEAWNNLAQQTCHMTEIFCGTVSGIEWVCSECGSTCFVSEPLDTDEKPHYCPNCGAKVVD